MKTKNVVSLHSKTVTVVGIGSIGSVVCELLAKSGVGLRIIDRDRVKEEDLHRLSLFTPDHLLKFKAKEAKVILEKNNPKVRVKAFHEDLGASNAYLVEADVIIECSGDMSTALIVDKAAKKIPVVVARAGECTGSVFVVDDVRLKSVQKFLEKHLDSTPITYCAAHIIAALAVEKALQVLSLGKCEKSLLVVDFTKFSMEKVPLRKD